MAYLEELLPEFRKGAKIRCVGWSKEKYIHIPDPELGDVLDETGKVTTIPFWYTIEDFWEFYQGPIDWDYIIKNKCLCWFFDSNEEVIGSAGILTEVKSREEYPFIKTFNGIKFGYQHCRPVRKDEVTFYEDREEK